jgi:ABC-type uncharacterized transport system substrate-binding protein
MGKIKAKVIGSGKPDDPFRVNLPTFQMVHGTEEYADEAKTKLIAVVVEVPDDELDEKGALSKEKIRKKYEKQPKWDHDKVTDDVAV